MTQMYSKNTQNILKQLGISINANPFEVMQLLIGIIEKEHPEVREEEAWGSWLADKKYLEYVEKQLKKQKNNDLQIDLFKPSDDTRKAQGDK